MGVKGRGDTVALVGKGETRHVVAQPTALSWRSTSRPGQHAAAMTHYHLHRIVVNIRLQGVCQLSLVQMPHAHLDCGCCVAVASWCSYDQLRQMTNSNTVVVLPAFETAPQKNMTLAHQLADTAAMMNKAQLGRLVQKKLIYQFALYLFRQVGVIWLRVGQGVHQY